MKRYRKEIVLGSTFFLILCITTGLFYTEIRQEKKMASIDLSSLLLPGTEGVMVVNRPDDLRSTILPYPNIKSVFSRFLPDIYFSVIQEVSCPLLFSFHPKGVVLYAKINKDEMNILKGIFTGYFNNYAPYLNKEEKIRYHSYPDTEGRFFNYHYQNGIFISSYSGKLLESAIEGLNSSQNTTSSDLHKAIRGFDTHVPFNVCIPAQRIDSLIYINDSLSLVIEDQWISSDYFTNEGNICSFGYLPVSLPQDSVNRHMADSALNSFITDKYRELFPSLFIETQVSIEPDKISYTGCSPFISIEPKESDMENEDVK